MPEEKYLKRWRKTAVKQNDMNSEIMNKLVKDCEDVLDRCLPDPDHMPEGEQPTATIASAMRYNVLAGGMGRVTHDIPLDRLLAAGPKDEIFKEYGGAQTYEKAVVGTCSLPEMALAYAKDDGGAAALLVIQPDEAMCRHLTGKKNRTNREEDAK